MSDKVKDVAKLIEKMRANTEKQNQKTAAKPLRRFRKKMQKVRRPDEPENQA